MVFVSEDIARDKEIASNHICIYLGEKEFKGIGTDTSCFSLIRSVENGRNKRCCSPEDCASATHFSLCDRAWHIGFDARGKGKKPDVTHDLYCSQCPDSQCWHYKYCLPKEINSKKEHPEETQCCHICSHFRNCLNAYYMGMQGTPLISCDYDITTDLKTTKDASYYLKD